MDEANRVELALQVEGYVSHTVIGSYLLVSATRAPWPLEVWLNGQRYRFSSDSHDVSDTDGPRFLAAYVSAGSAGKPCRTPTLSS